MYISVATNGNKLVVSIECTRRQIASVKEFSDIMVQGADSAVDYVKACYISDINQYTYSRS